MHFATSDSEYVENSTSGEVQVREMSPIPKRISPVFADKFQIEFQES